MTEAEARFDRRRRAVGRVLAPALFVALWLAPLPGLSPSAHALAAVAAATVALWITGGLYLFYDKWPAWGLGGLPLEWVALGHTIGAFMMLAFLIAHVYLTTAGHTPMAHIKAMITGWEEVA